jgi:hypothetical protein
MTEDKDMTAIFSEPDWRGAPVRVGEPLAPLRPMASVVAQEERLADWIRGGACYGWLNAYEARRASFELQAIRAERSRAAFSADRRRGVQSRLDALEALLKRARGRGER